MALTRQDALDSRDGQGGGAGSVKLSQVILQQAWKVHCVQHLSKAMSFWSPCPEIVSPSTECLSAQPPSLSQRWLWWVLALPAALGQTLQNDTRISESSLSPQLFCAFQALQSILCLYKGIRSFICHSFSACKTNFFPAHYIFQGKPSRKASGWCYFALLTARRATSWLQELEQESKVIQRAGADKSWKHLGSLQLLNPRLYLQPQDLNTLVVNTSFWKIPIT